MYVIIICDDQFAYNFLNTYYDSSRAKNVPYHL